ncbi:MAG: hypothetical protein NUV77_14175 [Thermoguttaceae bacterium]|jgi:hypothetical protein|nr:hypothetical protein [Thermoguttaceae bacterium]
MRRRTSVANRPAILAAEILPCDARARYGDSEEFDALPGSLEPRQGVLAKLPDAALGQNELAVGRQLEKGAAAKIEAGAIEPATEDW